MIRSKFTWFFAVLLAATLFGLSALTGSKEMTVSHLLEQARGDKIHWNTEGKPPEFWDSFNHRHYNRYCKKFAIQELGRRGSDSQEAVPELIRLFIQHDDWDSGDGVVDYRSDIARTLGAIDDPAAIAHMINLIREKCSTPDPKTGRGPMRWHDGSVHYDDGRGCGPDGIVEGLMLFSDKHHPEILERLAELQPELEAMALPNKWAKRAVTDAIEFFQSPSRQDKTWQVEFIKMRHDLAEVE